jgi:hypothetical protein
VYRDLGSEQHAPDDPDFIEIIEMPFEFDGALLLCSDGLSDQVTSAEILKLTISHAGDPQAAVRALIRAANAAGGKDNVTVLIVEGPGFAASRVQPPARPASGLLRSRAAFFTYGFLTVLVLLFIFIRVQSKAPKAPSPPPGPRVLAVGSGYGRVEEAMRAAHPGDTVELPPGEYREAVRLREGVTLAAREPRAAVLMASPVAVTAENLRSGRIIGLRIQGDGQIPLATGILLTSSTVEVADCEISGATNAIEVQGASQALIRANALHDNTGSAILVRDLAAPRITHNEIARNGRNRRDPRAGITLTGPASPVITGNVFADNGGGPVAFPAGTDGSPVLKQNFILKPPPAGGSKR